VIPRGKPSQNGYQREAVEGCKTASKLIQEPPVIIKKVKYKEVKKIKKPKRNEEKKPRMGRKESGEAG